MGAAPSEDGGRDLTVVAVPFYFATMALEYLVLRRRRAARGPGAGDYERRDTVASLTMGVASLAAPLVGRRLLRPLTPGRGRYGRALVAGALGAVVTTTVADAVARRTAPARTGATARQAASSSPAPAPDPGGEPGVGSRPGTVRTGATAEDGSARVHRLARRVAAVGGVTSVVAGGVAVTTTWASRTTPERLWRHRLVGDLGAGPLALAAAVVAWDFVYYWDHRFMHTSRYMWAVHVVHHSSEHYNLSTALRQPVAEAFGTFLPFGGLCLLGIRPALVETARGVNLLYQYWIHTETIGRLGPSEAVLNTPSHHRVHHGSNRRYLDRNHGSILIVWDRLFGTFEPETEPVVYGLTANIDTFNPLRIATHEYRAMLGDVASATSWRERLSYVVRGPGWAKEHRAALAAAGTGGEVAAPVHDVAVSA
ncbi:MAG TPA: sterol desaturase family protein [Acidimicrobiales bacterium]|nr:sterol desaturase family protein [Acidimicrobiales bacterium]